MPVLTTSLALTVVAIALAVVAIYAGIRAMSGSRQDSERMGMLSEAMNRLVEAQAALTGRMSQMAEGQAAAQNHVAERLQAQERNVTKFLDERLAEVTRRVGENLQKSGDKTTESLSQLQERLAVIDSAQKNIAELSQGVLSLKQLLSNKQARGAVAQSQMEDLVRDMLPPDYFSFQHTLSNGRRADCLLRLPNPPGSVCVDSKYPLEAFARMLDAETDDIRKVAAKDFGRDVEKHIDDIADKYIIPGETGDVALMFVPSDSIFVELQNNFQAVVQYGFKRKVFLVSPNSLWAILNTVRALIRDAKIREQAEALQAEIGKMAEDVLRLQDRVGKLGTHFKQASEDIRQIEVSTSKIVKRGTNIAQVNFENAESLEQAKLSLADDSES
ncbi:MAG: DNA recombination protein RmuC [Rhodospirillaceae bacterium]|nr:DNA recombination protein RmuC [Rhodospirillaceae bacterium]